MLRGGQVYSIIHFGSHESLPTKCVLMANPTVLRTHFMRQTISSLFILDCKEGSPFIAVYQSGFEVGTCLFHLSLYARDVFVNSRTVNLPSLTCPFCPIFLRTNKNFQFTCPRTRF